MSLKSRFVHYAYCMCHCGTAVLCITEINVTMAGQASSSRPNFYGLGLEGPGLGLEGPGLGLESCIENHLASTSNSGPRRLQLK